jgi:hypothetical protein
MSLTDAHQGGKNADWKLMVDFKMPSKDPVPRVESRRVDIHLDDIWYAVRWSRQPPEQPDGMSLERYQWMLVEDFAAIYNDYRQRTFVPGGHLEANTTVFRWYGKGGAFVDAGCTLPSSKSPTTVPRFRILPTLRRGSCSI